MKNNNRWGSRGSSKKGFLWELTQGIQKSLHATTSISHNSICILLLPFKWQVKADSMTRDKSGNINDSICCSRSFTSKDHVFPVCLLLASHGRCWTIILPSYLSPWIWLPKTIVSVQWRPDSSGYPGPYPGVFIYWTTPCPTSPPIVAFKC